MDHAISTVVVEPLALYRNPGPEAKERTQLGSGAGAAAESRRRCGPDSGRGASRAYPEERIEVDYPGGLLGSGAGRCSRRGPLWEPKSSPSPITPMKLAAAPIARTPLQPAFGLAGRTWAGSSRIKQRRRELGGRLIAQRGHGLERPVEHALRLAEPGGHPSLRSAASRSGGDGAPLPGCTRRSARRADAR